MKKSQFSQVLGKHLAGKKVLSLRFQGYFFPEIIKLSKMTGVARDFSFQELFSTKLFSGKICFFFENFSSENSFGGYQMGIFLPCFSFLATRVSHISASITKFSILN